MPKKCVKRLTYQILNLIFHSLCLSGLTWQITQISINFFKFDVIKDINVIMAEELKNDDSVLYVCFENHEILQFENFLSLVYSEPQRYGVRQPDKQKKVDMPVFKSRVLQMLNIHDRFYVTPDSLKLCEVEDLSGKYPEVSEFVYGSRYCYQFNISNMNCNFRRSWTKNVSSILISRGRKLPLFDSRGLLAVDAKGSINHSVIMRISSYFYSIKKLKWPYTDDCFDYQTINFADRLAAILNCSAEKTKLKPQQFLDRHIVLKKQYSFWNYTIDYSRREDEERNCKKRLKLDCSNRIYVTKVSLLATSDTFQPVFVIKTDQDSNPSFTIKSKPRIDNIDFVTYILGALGAWLGFSFIGINPVPKFFVVEGVDLKNRTEQSSGIGSSPEINNKFQRRIALVERKCDRNLNLMIGIRKQIDKSIARKIETDNINKNVLKEINKRMLNIEISIQRLALSTKA